MVMRLCRALCREHRIVGVSLFARRVEGADVGRIHRGITLHTRDVVGVGEHCTTKGNEIGGLPMDS